MRNTQELVGTVFIYVYVTTVLFSCADCIWSSCAFKTGGLDWVKGYASLAFQSGFDACRQNSAVGQRERVAAY